MTSFVSDSSNLSFIPEPYVSEWIYSPENWLIYYFVIYHTSRE